MEGQGNGGQDGQKDQDVEGQALAEAEDEQRGQGILGIVEPGNGVDAEEAEEVVQQAVVAVEDPAPHDADGDDAGDVGQEVQGLEDGLAPGGVVDKYSKTRDSRMETGTTNTT